MRPRKLIHLDLDAFFCAVEELRCPELRGKPFAVGGRPNQRGVVSSCSYAARQYGVHSAMPMAQALRACPGLRVIHPDSDAYHEASAKVMAILHRRTALVEQLSIDEAFLDLTDLPEAGLELARALQMDIQNETQLPSSLGVGTNKLIAKTANDVGKSRHREPTPPQVIMVVPPGQEAAFLSPLPVKTLWGVGPKTAARLTELGIQTIGELARVPEAVLTRQFGQAGRDMFRHAQGIDDRAVIPERAAKSISSETTFDRDVTNAETLRSTLRTLSEDVARTLREKDLCAGVIRLKIRWQDFSTHTRQTSLQQPTDQDGIITATVLSLLDSIWTDGRPVRLIGVGTGRLAPCAHQLSLWDTANEKERRLLDALDTLRERFGDNVVRSGWRGTPQD
jgi:DNA polymerase-4